MSMRPTTVRCRLTVLWLGVGLLGTVLIGAPTHLLADELQTLFRGVRPAGMANAFITLSDDDNALFYNPAGLNDITGVLGHLALINPLVEVSTGVVDLATDFQNVNKDDLAKVTELLNKNLGKHGHGRAALYPNYTRHNFGLGILAQGTLDADIRNPTLPQADVDGRADIGGALGFAYGFKKRLVQVGGTGKFFQRKALKPNPRTFTVTDIAGKQFDPLKDQTDQADFAFDLGTKVNFPVLLSPTVAVVAQNLTDLDFKEVGLIPSTINAAVAINPNFWVFGTTVAVEVDDLGNKLGTDKDLGKRLHVGAELRLPIILSLRAGVNQGYLTGGFTLNFWILKLAYATYAEEVGAFAGQRGDRRHLAQLFLGF